MNYIHGLCKTRLYHIWKTMRQRCYNSKNLKYKNYGARGIKICKEWESFKNFYEWALQNNYNDSLSIDRIDCNGNYSPDNCRWVDYITQANNKTSNVFIYYNGEKMTMSNFCRKYNLKYKIFAKYNKLGKPIEFSMEKAKKR